MNSKVRTTSLELPRRRKPWRSAAKDLADGFIYGLLTGGAFGWLWPR